MGIYGQTQLYNGLFQPEMQIGCCFLKVSKAVVVK